MVRPISQQCGTYAAARRHQRNGEPLCEACKAALAAHQRAMYESRRALVASRTERRIPAI